MKDPLIHKGYWYLPGNGGHKVPGTLTYLPGQKIELEVWGALRENASLVDLFNHEKFPVIYGETSVGKKITLLNCFSRAGFHGGCRFPVIICDCRYLLEGLHLEEQTWEIFHSIMVRMPQLTAWAHPGALRHSIADDREGNREFTFAFNSSVAKKKICEVSIGNNTLLSLRSWIDYNSSFFLLHPQIEQYTYLVIETTREKRSLEDLLGKAHLFIQFLSLATLQIPVPTEISLFLNNPLPCAEQGSMVKLYYTTGPAANPPQEGNPAREHCLFTYGQIKDSFESIMHKFDDIDKIKSAGIDIDATVDSRHYYSHFMEREDRPKTLEGIPLYELTKKLKLLLLCSLLHLTGLENGQINDILNNSANSLTDL